MSAISNDFKQTLSVIADVLNANDITWWLGASSALYVQGVDVTPKDLDIIVDINQFDKAYELLGSLQPADRQTGDFAGEPYYKAELEGAAFPAELVGFVPDGSEVASILWEEVAIRVHPLSVELEMYKKRTGKEHVVGLIEAAMKARS